MSSLVADKGAQINIGTKGVEDNRKFLSSICMTHV